MVTAVVKATVVQAEAAEATREAGTAAARPVGAQETAPAGTTATRMVADVVAGLEVLATATVGEMPAEAKAVEAATPAIRGMLAAMETATVMVEATGTVEEGAAAQETEIATAAAKATLTPVVLVAA
jgi:hypothetical protein